MDLHTFVFLSTDTEKRRLHLLAWMKEWNIAPHVHILWHARPVGKYSQWVKISAFVERAVAEYPEFATLTEFHDMDWSTTLVLFADDDDLQHPQRLSLYLWGVQQQPEADVWKLPVTREPIRNTRLPPPLYNSEELWACAVRGDLLLEVVQALSEEDRRSGLCDVTVMQIGSSGRVRTYLPEESPWCRPDHPLSTCWNYQFRKSAFSDYGKSSPPLSSYFISSSFSTWLIHHTPHINLAFVGASIASLPFFYHRFWTRLGPTTSKVFVVSGCISSLCQIMTVPTRLRSRFLAALFTSASMCHSW